MLHITPTVVQLSSEHPAQLISFFWEIFSYHNDAATPPPGRLSTHTTLHSFLFTVPPHTPIKGGWGCSGDRTNTVLGPLPSGAIVQTRSKETERKVGEGWTGWRGGVEVASMAGSISGWR